MLICWNKFKHKSIPIKSVLLDQRIIAGIGNIYDDEILFASHISPLRPAKKITAEEAANIIENTKKYYQKQLKWGGLL